LDQAEAVRYAREMTGMVCSEEEEHQAHAEFTAWADAHGLSTQFYRTVAVGGRVLWVLRVVTVRGNVETAVQDPRAWKTAMRGVGFGGLL
jgi:hypothetical protein